MPINITDLIVLAILVVSGLLAFARGFVHEVLSAMGWVGAAAATWFLFPLAAPLARQMIEFTLIADLVTGTVIFLVWLVGLSWISHKISRRVRDSALNALDRSLGFLFGVARGIILTCIAWILYESTLPPSEHPAWISEARSLPLIEKGSDLLVLLAAREGPEGGRDAFEKMIEETARRAGDAVDDIIRESEKAATKAAGEAAGKALESQEILPKDYLAPRTAPAPDADTQDEKGYKSNDRRQMERLLEDQAE